MCILFLRGIFVSVKNFGGISALKKAQNEQIQYVMGWFGTETHGDKMMLLSLLEIYYKNRQANEIVVCSQNQAFTLKSLRELVSLVDESFGGWILRNVQVERENAFLVAGKQSKVIFCGGPLMDDPRLLFWVVSLGLLRFRNVPVFIFGCGVGPLRSKFSRFLVSLILSNATASVVRPSEGKYSELTALADATVLCPSVLSVKAYFDGQTSVRGACATTIAINVRHIPGAYWPNYESSVSPNEKIQNGMAQLLSRTESSKIIGFSTHELDAISDSDITSSVLENLGARNSATTTVTDLKDVLDLIFAADLIVSTRYHGFVFGLCSNNSTIGVEYGLGGGKLEALAGFLKKKEMVVRVPELESFDLNIPKASGSVDEFSGLIEETRATLTDLVCGDTVVGRFH